MKGACVIVILMSMVSALTPVMYRGSDADVQRARRAVMDRGRVAAVLVAHLSVDVLLCLLERNVHKPIQARELT